MVQKNSLMLTLLCLPLMMWAVALPAQTTIQTPAQADSLRRVLASAHSDTADTARVNALNALSFYFGHTISQYDSALHYLRIATLEAERIGFRRGVAEALNTLANVSRNQGAYNEALEQSRQSLQISEELQDKRGTAKALNTTGNVYRNQGEQPIALEYFFRALPIAEQTGDKTIIATTTYYISMAYRGLRKFGEALHYCVNALRMFRELNDKRGIAGTLHNLSVIHRVQNKHDEALQFSSQSLKVSEEIGDKDGIASSLHSMAEAYCALGNNAETLRYTYKALKAKENLGHKEGVAGLLINFATVYLRLRVYDSAQIYSLRAIALADSIGTRSRKLQALGVLSKCYESLGQHKLALQSYRLYGELKDSLVNLENLNATSALKEGYEAEKRQQQIVFLNKEKTLQTTELSNQNIVQRFLVGILVIILFVAVLLGWLYRQKRLANAKIIQQQQALEEQSHEIEAANMELNAANAELHKANSELNEANRFKTEILSIAAHDLKNPLSAISGFTEMIADELPAEHKSQPLLEHIVSTVGRMSKLIYNLLDSAVIELGNMTIRNQPLSLSLLVLAMIDRYTLPAQNKGQFFIVEMDDKVGSGEVLGDVGYLEQVFDNLVSNAVKYSPLGGRITVRILSAVGNAGGTESESIRVEIQDEGAGLSAEDQSKLFGFFQRLSAQPTGGEGSNGVGLAVVKKIVDLHNGNVWCESQKDEGILGATFVVELPAEKIATVNPENA
jgi:signal transduction histidine kinase